jgi:SAM-dependent methyltransferase
MATWLTIGVAVAATGWFAYRTLADRRVSQEAERLAVVLRLGADSRVADVGAGDGAFTRALAAHVVSVGHVFATEIEPKMVERLRARAADDGLTNISALLAGDDSTALPEACCDAAFLRGVYHHIARPDAVNLSLRSALRPGGRLAIIDFAPSWFLSTFFPVRGVPPNRGGHGVPSAIVVAELEAAGFTLVEQYDNWSRGSYGLVFER